MSMLRGGLPISEMMRAAGLGWVAPKAVVVDVGLGRDKFRVEQNGFVETRLFPSPKIWLGTFGVSVLQGLQGFGWALKRSVLSQVYPASPVQPQILNWPTASRLLSAQRTTCPGRIITIHGA